MPSVKDAKREGEREREREGERERERGVADLSLSSKVTGFLR